MFAQSAGSKVHPGAVLARLVATHKRYGRQVALAGVDLAVRAGEVLAVLGPNGAGKSTALGLMTGRLRADAGRAELFSRDPREPAARRRIGVMIQDATLPDAARVGELVRQFSGYYPAPRPLAQTIALAGLEGLVGRRYDALSGGQKRRVQFALAICGRPQLLFVDEPTVGLDADARRGLWRVLQAMRREGAAIVLTTHYIEEADALADRVVLMAAGKVLAEDTPAGIKARAGGKRLRCRTRLATEELARWPQLQAVASEAGVTECRTHSVESLLLRLFAADPQLHDLEVLPLSLEEAVLALSASGHAREAVPAVAA